MGIGSVKIRKTSLPSAGNVYAFGSVTTRSGVPSCQPSPRGAVGQMARIAFGRPALHPSSIILSSASLSGCWPMNGPFEGSAFHGGMNRFFVTVAICVAWRFASA